MPTAHPDPLPSDLARALASDNRLGSFGLVRYFSEVDSTNDIALTLALDAAPEGTSVLADTQRAGRGRRGRTWFSPPGAGVYLSTIVRPTTTGAPVSLITLAAGVAVADAITTTTGLPIELKWPNDVVIGRPWRKLSGLLCESVGAGAVIDAVIIGIGINLHPAAYPPDLANRATSIETELGRPVDSAPIVVECLAQLRHRIENIRDADPSVICEAWRRLGKSCLSGAPVRWHNHDLDQEHQGVTRDIDADGALLVERDGQIDRLVSGDVHWEGLS